MAGLLDFINTPAGVGLLSAVAGGMAGARKGTPWNNAGRAGLAGVMGYQGAQDQVRQDQDKAFANQLKSLQMQQLEQTLARQKGEQNWKAGLPAVMAPKLTGTTEQGQQLAEQNAAFGQEGLPALAESAQYAQPDAPLNMNYGVDKQAMQDYLMQPDSPYADKMLERQYFPDKESRTAEQKNFEYAQTLPEDQRQLFMSRAGGGSAPATVQEWEYFNKLDPQAQGRFLEMKRNPQIMNLGGSQAVRAPGGGISENYAVTPKITDMPDFQAAQETAKVTAKETASRGAEATSNLPKVQASATNARNMIQGIINHPGFSSTVGMTALPGARFVPGTKEADFQSRMDQLKGTAFLQAFETLKGSGQITEVEGKKATDAINRMSISTSEKEFKAAAKDFLSVVDLTEQNAKRAAKPARQPSANRVLDRGEILNVELQDAISRGDAQNTRLIRQEMSRMGVKEAGGQQAKQSAGTFKDPIRVTNDADYNNVPKGKYYKAPDGSIRVRK